MHSGVLKHLITSTYSDGAIHYHEGTDVPKDQWVDSLSEHPCLPNVAWVIQQMIHQLNGAARKAEATFSRWDRHVGFAQQTLRSVFPSRCKFLELT